MLTQQSLMHQRLQQHAPQRIERSEEHTSELQSRLHLVCRLLLEKKKDHNKPIVMDRQDKGLTTKRATTAAISNLPLRTHEPGDIGTTHDARTATRATTDLSPAS